MLLDYQISENMAASLTYAVLLCAVLWEVHGKTRVLSCLCCMCSDRHNCAVQLDSKSTIMLSRRDVIFNYFLLLAMTPSFLSCSVCVIEIIRWTVFILNGTALAWDMVWVINVQENKNIKNVKRCRDGMPKNMQTR